MSEANIMRPLQNSTIFGNANLNANQVNFGLMVLIYIQFLVDAFCQNPGPAKLSLYQ
jgi:hypothetical protein